MSGLASLTSDITVYMSPGVRVSGAIKVNMESTLRKRVGKKTWRGRKAAKTVFGSCFSMKKVWTSSRPAYRGGSPLYPTIRGGCLLSMSWYCFCLLYTSDAADDLLCVDLGGRR